MTDEILINVSSTEKISLSMESSSGQTTSVLLELTEISGPLSLVQLIFAKYAEKYGLADFSNQTEIVFHMKGQLNMSLLPDDAFHVDKDFSSSNLN